MFAIVAAILFGFALLLDLIDGSLEPIITIQTLTLAGLLFLALHFSGAGTGSWRGRSWRGRRSGRG